MYFKARYFSAFLLALFCSATLPANAADSPSLETLLAYLKSPIINTRRDAAHKLGERRARNQLVVEALAVAAHSDEDHDVRAEAIEALGKIKDLSALPEMLDGLKDQKPEVRRIAVRSLVALYTEHDIDFITNQRTGWNRLNPFLDTSDHEIIESYIVVDESIIKALGESAKGDRASDVRVAAVRALGVLRGRPAIPQLADALNADQDLRIDVIRAFIKIGDPAAGQHLIPFFSDSNQKVRTQSMVAAGMLKCRDAVDPLLSIYGLGPEKKGAVGKIAGKVKGRFQYRPPCDEAALWALSLIGDNKAEQVFVENMDDGDADRRQYAFEGLARLGEPRYLDQISRLVLTERHGDVKLAQQWALYKMGSKQEIQPVVRKLDSLQSEQARTYLMEPASPADLYPFIRSSSKTIKHEIIDILGRIGDQAAIPELEETARASGATTADVATVAIKRIEWRMSGRPRATDEVLKREERPRRTSGN